MSDTNLSRAVWRKSHYSNGQANCVEIATHPAGFIGVRDSKNPQDGVLMMSFQEWRGFVQRTVSGDLRA